MALPHPPFDFALLCGSLFFFFLVGPASRPLPALPLAGLSFRTWEVHPAGAKPLKAVFHAQPLSAPDSTRAAGQAPQLLLTSRCGQRGGARRPVLASLAESTELEAWTRREKKKKLQSPPMTQLSPKFAKT